MRTSISILVALLLTGCVRLEWRRELRFAPPPSDAVEGLRANEMELQDCLDLFGAPLWVWRTSTTGGPGSVLAYGWYDSKQWRVDVSVPVTDFVSPSFDYSRIDERMQGLVLFFDDDWRLTSWRRGLLTDLTNDLGRG